MTTMHDMAKLRWLLASPLPGGYGHLTGHSPQHGMLQMLALWASDGCRAARQTTFMLEKSRPGGMTTMQGMCRPILRRVLSTASSFLSNLRHGTMRFGSTAKVLLKCKLKYYRISECMEPPQSQAPSSAPSKASGYARPGPPPTSSPSSSSSPSSGGCSACPDTPPRTTSYACSQQVFPCPLPQTPPPPPQMS